MIDTATLDAMFWRHQSIFVRVNGVVVLMEEPMSVADLLWWQEIHPGTHTETWAWSPAGLGCVQNGLVCVVRYSEPVLTFHGFSTVEANADLVGCSTHMLPALPMCRLRAQSFRHSGQPQSCGFDAHVETNGP